MARNILKSNSSMVIAGERPAFTEVDRTGNAMSGAYMSAVQSVSVGFSQPRQKSKQVGSQDLAVNDITRMPDVDLSISYYYTPAMLNENLLGLVDSNPSYDGTGFFNGYTNEDQNFYIINQESNSSDLIVDTGNGRDVDFKSGLDIVSIGNAFLTNYSLGFSIGSLPVVSTTYKCSNIRMSRYVEDDIINPAINLQSGNNNGVGNVDVSIAQKSGFDYYSNINRLSPPLCSPQDLNITLENLQIGGTKITGDAVIQSFDFNIPVNRVDLFGLGSDYPYGRKIQYPIQSSVSVEFLVSGISAGNIASLISNESYYDFDIQVVDTGAVYQNTFSFENLRLENSSYQMQVNGQMTYSLGFSFEITN